MDRRTNSKNKKRTKSRNKTKDFKEIFDGEQEKIDDRQSVDVGLDISTSVVGIVVLDSKNGNLQKMHAVKLNSVKFSDIWDKASKIRKELSECVDLTKQKVERVFVEEAHMKFTPGFSSANTLFSLARFNGIISYISHEIFDVKPIMVNVRSARKQLGIKINYKDKSKDTKTKVFEAVRTLNPDFPWVTHVAKTGKKKGETVWSKHNFDMADSWVICRGGQLIYPINKKRR